MVPQFAMQDFTGAWHGGARAGETCDLEISDDTGGPQSSPWDSSRESSWNPYVNLRLA